MADDLYFIRADDFVKIGRTRKVGQRVAAIQCGCPFEISEVIVWKGRGSQEAAWHRAFASERVRGEWFRWGDRIERVARHPVLSLPADELARRYEALFSRHRQRFAVAQAAAHFVVGLFPWPARRHRPIERRTV